MTLKKFRQLLGYQAFMLLGMLVRSLKRTHSVALAHFIGDVIFHVLRIRRSLVEENISIVFPDKSPKEVRCLAGQVYRNQAENIIEVLRLPLVQTREDAEALIEIEPGDFLLRTRDKGKGAVMVSAHFGNWELLGLCTGMLIAPLTIVVKRLRNRAIDRKINQWRSLRGNKMVYASKAPRVALSTLRQGGLLTLLADQSDPDEGFFTPFLGRTTSVFLGPAFLALKTGVPLFAGMCRRIGGGRYKVEMQEVPTDDLTGSKEDIEELARRYTRVLESYIYRYPEEWFWLHDRWKRSGTGWRGSGDLSPHQGNE